MTRRHNPRRVHRHRCYTISQLANLLKVTKGTISRWIKHGLEPIEWKRPYLFKGWVVAEFLAALNPARCPLADGECYCTPCKGPRRPSGGVVWLEHKTPTSANFVGRCSDCGKPLYRRVRYAEIQQKLGGLTIQYEDVSGPVSSSADGARMECSEDVEP